MWSRRRLGVLALCLFGSGCSEIAPEPAPAQVERATRWFDESAVDRDRLLQTSELERARAATFLTYRFCETGNGMPADPNDLYSECSTTCVGYAYVAEGLAQSLGLRTRRANLYNIPNQGNHTAIEILVDGEWSFFDPTFGAFFTEDGTAGGDVLGLWELSREPDLSANVVQAEEIAGATGLEAEIWEGEFDHEFMSLRNYQVAESITQGDPDELLLLNIPIRSGADAGDIELAERDLLTSAWLAYTNATLHDDDPLNDTSFASSLISNAGVSRTTLVTISDNEPNQPRCISVRLVNSNNSAQVIQVGAVGKTTKLLTKRYIEVSPGSAVHVIGYLPAVASAQLYLRHTGSGVTEMLGLRADCMDRAR